MTCNTCGGEIEASSERRKNCAACRQRHADRRRRNRAGIRSTRVGIGEGYGQAVNEATYDTYTRAELLDFRSRIPVVVAPAYTPTSAVAVC